MDYNNSDTKWQLLDPARKSPDFSLMSAAENEIISIDNIKSERTILTYLPGVWAPWCRKFLDYLNANIDIFDSDENPYKLSLTAIISQRYEDLVEYVIEHSIKFCVLSDPLGAIGMRYGVFDGKIIEPMQISKPSIFILDEQKYIRCLFLGKHLTDKPNIEDILAHAQLNYPPTEQKEVQQVGILGALKKFI